MERSYKKFYFTAIGVLLALSAYPLIMGLRIIILQLQNGSIDPEDYARYVIPYTAICLSVIIAAALHPFIAKIGKMQVLVATVSGFSLFTGIELYMESITFNSPQAKSAVQWQLLSCVGTPAAKRAFQGVYSDAYKIHYFLISFLIIALIISIVYGYGKLFKEENRRGRISLRLQIIAAVILLALCVFANFTGFFRDTAEYLSPLSAFLTGLFFIALGVTAGIYAGSFLPVRNWYMQSFISGLTAVLICSVMYYGEFKLLGGKLYRFSRSFIFEGLPYISLSPADVLIIAASGIIAALIVGVSFRKFYRAG